MIRLPTLLLGVSCAMSWRSLTWRPYTDWRYMCAPDQAAPTWHKWTALAAFKGGFPTWKSEGAAHCTAPMGRPKRAASCWSGSAVATVQTCSKQHLHGLKFINNLRPNTWDIFLHQLVDGLSHWHCFIVTNTANTYQLVQDFFHSQ
jgi:hypothetical protein